MKFQLFISIAYINFHADVRVLESILKRVSQGLNVKYTTTI